MEIATIGFTKKSAAGFFEPLKRAGIKRLIDVRLNNTSQLAGFTKRDYLAYFVAEICGIEYLHDTTLAPTAELLDAYRKQGGGWDEYQRQFQALLAERAVDQTLDRALFAERVVLLCSEPTAERCHRRLVAEYLAQRWGGVNIVHL